MTKDEAQRSRWTFYEAVKIIFKTIRGMVKTKDAY